MSTQDDTDAFYQRLKIELEKSTSWPSKYLYKFIIPTSSEKLAKIEAIFDNMGAVINTKKSSNAKYTSVSIELHMKNPDLVIEKYKEVSKIEGVISL